jgi:hypothetical protein
MSGLLLVLLLKVINIILYLWMIFLNIHGYIQCDSKVKHSNISKNSNPLLRTCFQPKLKVFNLIEEESTLTFLFKIFSPLTVSTIACLVHIHPSKMVSRSININTLSIPALHFSPKLGWILVFRLKLSIMSCISSTVYLQKVLTGCLLMKLFSSLS